jgi:hypothetical protein
VTISRDCGNRGWETQLENILWYSLWKYMPPGPPPLRELPDVSEDQTNTLPPRRGICGTTNQSLTPEMNNLSQVCNCRGVDAQISVGLTGDGRKGKCGSRRRSPVPQAWHFVGVHRSSLKPISYVVLSRLMCVSASSQVRDVPV